MSYSAMIPFVYVGKEDIHKYKRYGVSKNVYMGSIANQRKVPKVPKGLGRISDEPFLQENKSDIPRYRRHNNEFIIHAQLLVEKDSKD